MKIEHTEVFGFRASLRGMRNPMDSWDKSDSAFVFDYDERGQPLWNDVRSNACPSLVIQQWPSKVDGDNLLRIPEHPSIGPEDLKLACKLIRQGGDHRKFLRMIVVWCDFVLPRYVWQEVDTYKVGTVRNSCSTMNTLGKRELVQEDFENPLPTIFLAELNRAVADFREADGSEAKRGARVMLKDLLPEGFNQRATFLLNYEVAFRMFFSRRGHRLPMWREGADGSICEWIRTLPYMDQFVSVFEARISEPP